MKCQYLSVYASCGPRPAHSTVSKRGGTENRKPENRQEDKFKQRSEIWKLNIKTFIREGKNFFSKFETTSKLNVSMKKMSNLQKMEISRKNGVEVKRRKTKK